jgi:hypothetical protein
MDMLRTAALLVTAVVAGHSSADQRQWLNDIDTYTITRSSVVTAGDPPADFELADDFEVTGMVRRAIVYGHDCWQCAGVLATGVPHQATAWDSARLSLSPATMSMPAAAGSPRASATVR